MNCAPHNCGPDFTKQSSAPRISRCLFLPHFHILENTKGIRPLGCCANVSGRGIVLDQTPAAELLLLVIHRSAFELFALRIGAAGGDCTALTVSRHNNATACGDLAASLHIDLQSTVILLHIRTRVLIWVTTDGIVFAVEFAYG
jgi:hypothetical protein